MMSLLLFLWAGLLLAFVVLRYIRRTVVVRSGPWMFEEIRRRPDIARDRRPYATPRR